MHLQTVTTKSVREGGKYTNREFLSACFCHITVSLKGTLA